MQTLIIQVYSLLDTNDNLSDLTRSCLKYLPHVSTLFKVTLLPLTQTCIKQSIFPFNTLQAEKFSSPVVDLYITHFPLPKFTNNTRIRLENPASF